MRILLINHRYFVASGAERYLFSVEAGLGRAGHETAPFAISHEQNEPSPWSEYFTSPIGSSDEVFFDEYRQKPGHIIKSAARLMYSSEVARDLGRLIEDFRPDVAYVLLFQRKLSPAIFTALKQAHIPIVVRLSDFGFLCANNLFLRDGKVCTECHPGRWWPAVRHGCVHDSKVMSAATALASRLHKAMGLYDLIDRFVTTNPFLTRMMEEGGFDPNRLVCIPTFANASFAPRDPLVRPSYLLYAGRLDPSKGIETAIDAVAELLRRRPDVPPLVIAGHAQYASYSDRLTQQVRDRGLERNVRLIGQVSTGDMAKLYAQSIATIIPSLWYENLPNTYLENISAGVPVIASDRGSLKEAISDGEDGLLFAPGDASSLADKIELLLDDPALSARINAAALVKSQAYYSEEAHLARLVGLFETVVEEHRDAKAVG